MKCQIKIIKALHEIFPKYRPQVGQVYDADLSIGRKGRGWQAKKEFCIIHVGGRKVVVRKGEYEIV